MSGVDWKRSEREALVNLTQSIRRLEPTMPKSLFTKRAAAKRLQVSPKRLRILIAVGVVEVVEVGRRELVWLP